VNEINKCFIDLNTPQTFQLLHVNTYSRKHIVLTQKSSYVSSNHLCLCTLRSLITPANGIGRGNYFGVVPPSFRQFVRPSTLLLEFRFRAISLQLLSGIQRNFMGTYNTKRNCAFRRLVPVRPFNTELWPSITYADCILINNRFRAISMQLMAGIK
jgi:hypothetical protein